MIGGRGGNDRILKILGPPPEKPDEELCEEALLLRKLRRSIPVDFFEQRRRQIVPVLKGQCSIDGEEVE